MVADVKHQVLCIALEPLAQFGRHARPGRGRHFEELLVVALHRAVALVEGENVPPVVGDDLDLNVVNVSEVLFNKEPRVPERGLRHGGGFFKGVLELVLGRDEEDSASAAALGLEHDRKADLAREAARFRNVDRFVGSRHDRNPETARHAPRLDLVAEEMHGFGRGADEGDARFPAEFGEGVVFAGEPPARVNGDGAAFACKTDDFREIEIGAGVCAEKDEFLCGGGCRLRLVDVGRGDGRDGIESFAYGAGDSSRRNAAVCNKDDLAAQAFADLLKRALLHAGFLPDKRMVIGWIFCCFPAPKSFRCSDFPAVSVLFSMF